MTNSHPHFRKDIAFLRAFAVIVVVCYHLKIPFFESGYMGVDIFFVLSGYLMTALLLKEPDLSVKSILSFYLARLRRLFPALMCVLLLFIIPIYFIIGIKLYDYSRFAFSSLLFFSNWYYYLNSGYFDAASELNFLVHTWTLSLEGQFYILFPIIILFSRKIFLKSHFGLFAVLALVTIASFLGMIQLKDLNESYAFYSLQTRVWEFTMGAFVFVLAKILPLKRPTLYRRFFSGLGFLLLVFVFFGSVSKNPAYWPSWLTLVPVFATALVLFFSPEVNFFGHRIVLFIASRSYSWYLWHWPIVVLFYYLNLGDLWFIKVGIFFTSLLLANLTYLFVEKKVHLVNSKVLITTISICAVLFFCGTRANLYAYVFAKEQADLFSYFYNYPRQRTTKQYGFHQGHLRERERFQDFDTTSLNHFSQQLPNYLLIGDCHAGMFSQTLHNLARENGVNLLQATADETFPSQNSLGKFAGPKELMDYIFQQYLPKNSPRIQRVILMANYSGYSKKQLDDFLKGNQKYFLDLGIPITYIGQTESYKLEYPVLQWLEGSVGLNPNAQIMAFRGNTNDYLKSLGSQLDYIDVYRRVDHKSGSGGQTYFYDGEHLSSFGTKQLMIILQNKLFMKP